MPEKINVPFYAYKGDQPYIFISYSHRDSEEVFPIIGTFKDAGFNIWYDEGIEPGNEWPLEIERSLKNSAIFLVFITPNSVNSRNVRNEINYALSNNLPFLAIYLEETELVDGLGLQMGSTQAIMKHRMDDESFYYKGATVLNQMLNTEIPPPAAGKSTVPFRIKRKSKTKNLFFLGAAAAVIIGITIFIIVISGGGDVYFQNVGLGISFTHSKNWEIMENSGAIIALYDKKTGIEIYIIDLTNDIVTFMSEGDDIITAAERSVNEYACRMAYFYDVNDNICYIEFNDRMLIEGVGSFSYDPPINTYTGEPYTGSIVVDFTVRQHENRIFAYAFSIPGHYNYKDYDKFKNIYDEILTTVTVEKNPMSIGERVAELSPKG